MVAAFFAENSYDETSQNARKPIGRAMSQDLYEIEYHLEKAEGAAGWPYVVWYYPESDPPFLVGEGVEFGSGSMQLSAAEILDPV